MKRAALLCLLATPAFAQAYTHPACSEPDRLEIRDDGPGRAIVTFYNSRQNCSQELRQDLTSPNGIKVRVVISLGGEADEYRERITLEPLTDQYQAYPPEGWLLDGEEAEFVVQGGLS